MYEQESFHIPTPTLLTLNQVALLTLLLSVQELSLGLHMGCPGHDTGQ